MLDIIFYSVAEPHAEYVDLSEDFYAWLSYSEFSKIGQSEPSELEIDGEYMSLPLIALGETTRSAFSRFLRAAIVEESDQVLDRLTESVPKEDYQRLTYRLRKLQELRKCVENKSYQYLQRV